MTDEAKAEPQSLTLVVEPLPYFFADQEPSSMWIWMFQTVMQHSETPLTPKTLDFIDQAYERALQRLSGRQKTQLEVVK